MAETVDEGWSKLGMVLSAATRPSKVLLLNDARPQYDPGSLGMLSRPSDAGKTR